MKPTINNIHCLIISTGRAASTAVYQYLSQGCGLNLPANKEPHHWFKMENFKGLYPLLDTIYVPDRDNYYELYSNSPRIIDASCGYFFYMEEVIENLKGAGKNPKVVFLYRDPVSRAASIFNEWKKKGLTSRRNVLEDVIKVKDVEPGYWWEYYYDNVLYMKQFDLMKDYFNNMLLVNYDEFARNPSTVFRQIADFLDVTITANINYTAINSSVEAKLSQKHRALMRYFRLAPLALRNKIMAYWAQKSKSDDMKYYSELPQFLPESMKEYSDFRKTICNRDLLCISK